MSTPSDEWYARHICSIYEALSGCAVSSHCDPRRIAVKLIHPEGRARFATNGVVFLDLPLDADTFLRLCVLFPGQRMRLHHHKSRVEVFKVLAGVVLALTREPGDGGGGGDGESQTIRSDRVRVGQYLAPALGQEHGVATDSHLGGVYLGICHREHMTDVYWAPDEADPSSGHGCDTDAAGISAEWQLVDAPSRVTVLPVSQITAAAAADGGQPSAADGEEGGLKTALPCVSELRCYGGGGGDKRDSGSDSDSDDGGGDAAKTLEEHICDLYAESARHTGHYARLEKL